MKERVNIRKKILQLMRIAFIKNISGTTFVTVKIMTTNVCSSG